MTSDELNIAVRNAQAETQALRHRLSQALSPLLVEVMDGDCNLDDKVSLLRLSKIRDALQAQGVRIDL